MAPARAARCAWLGVGMRVSRQRQPLVDGSLVLALSLHAATAIRLAGDPSRPTGPSLCCGDPCRGTVPAAPAGRVAHGPA